jgi:hypothetical protein
MDDPAKKVKKLYCNQCHQNTNHVLKSSHTRFADEAPGLICRSTYNMWVCAGCESAALEEAWNIQPEPLPDEELAFDDEEDEFTYYPPRSTRHVVGKHYAKLGEKLASIYQECVICFNAGAYVLCAAGLRSLLEGICADKKVKGRNLEERIDHLEFLLPNKNIVRHLHHFRFIGNRAMHELEAPGADDVRLAIGVIEDLMNFLYELDYKASRLKLKKAKRHRKNLSKRSETVKRSLIATASIN